MPEKYPVQTEKKNKIKLASSIISAEWMVSAAYGATLAGVRVRTALVGEGAAIEIKGQSSEGKAPGTIKGKVYSNCFVGELEIPAKVKPYADIWFEVKLPKLGIKLESLPIPARPPIVVRRMQWSAKEARRGDELTMTCEFETEIPDDSPATVLIYEYDCDGTHDLITKMPTVVQGQRVEVKWSYEYYEDTDEIPTQEELKKYGKNYNPPEYFFVVALEGTRVGVKQESGLLRFKDQNRVRVLDSYGIALQKKEFAVYLPDGTVTRVKTDDNGCLEGRDYIPGKIAIYGPLYGNKAKDAPPSPPRDAFFSSTGKNVSVILPGWKPLVDSHMHIQSNHTCPLPVQWALVADTPLGRLQGDRKSITDLLCNGVSGYLVSLIKMGRFTDIGRLATDLIAGVHQGSLKNIDMYKDAAWIVMTEEEWDRAKSEEAAREKAGRRADLEKLSRQTAQNFDEDFHSATFRYYANSRCELFSIALLMDMTYMHFWGRWGIPVVIGMGDTFSYVNDYAAIVPLGPNEGAGFRIDPAVSIPKAGRQGQTQHLYAKQLALGEFSFSEAFRKFSEWNGAKDSKAPFVRFSDKEKCKELVNGKRHSHLVHHLPGDEGKWFEDYPAQQFRSEAAAVKHPFKFFIFYHFDPRRHYADDVSPQRFADEVLSQHAFLNSAVNRESLATYTPMSSPDLDASSVVFSPNPVLNSDSYWKNLLIENGITLSKAKDKIFVGKNSKEGGIYFGVKVYPRLGYKPEDFITYPHLKSYFEFCTSNKIPVTTHCSRGGMAAADYYCHVRYGQPNGGLESYPLSLMEYWFADTSASPKNWERVLETPGFTELKLNLAHFGGYDAWRDVGCFKAIEGAFPANPGKLPQKKQPTGNRQEILEQRASLYHGWVRKICEIIQKYPHVYTDISYFHLKEEEQDKAEGWDGDISTQDAFVENLLFLLEKFPALKGRLMVGSDWYMIEMHKLKGPGKLLSHQFSALKKLSSKVKYDAWHQFGVINPLRFLGLLKGEGEKMEIDGEKMREYGAGLLELSKNKAWTEKANCIGGTKTIEESIEHILKQVERNPNIPQSDTLKDANGEFFIALS